MARADIDKTIIIKKAAEMANEIGLEKVTLKLLANQLNIKPPSLYNHIKGLDDLRIVGRMIVSPVFFSRAWMRRVSVWVGNWML